MTQEEIAHVMFSLCLTTDRTSCWVKNRTGMNPYRQTCTYDPAGNRTLLNNTGVRTTFAYDAATQLRYSDAAAGRTTFGFDAAGNQQRSVISTWALATATWNFANQQTLYRFPHENRANDVYNADDHRVQENT